MSIYSLFSLTLGAVVGVSCCLGDTIQTQHQYVIEMYGSQNSAVALMLASLNEVACMSELHIPTIASPGEASSLMELELVENNSYYIKSNYFLDNVVSKYLTARHGSLSFEDHTEDHTLSEAHVFKFVHLGFGVYEIVSKANPTQSISYDKPPLIIDDPKKKSTKNNHYDYIAVLAERFVNDKSKFILRPVPLASVKRLTFNRNGYHPEQEKRFCVIDPDHTIEVDHVEIGISAPTLNSGFTFSRMDKTKQPFNESETYFCKSFDDLKVLGRYVVSINGSDVVDEFYIQDDIFANPRSKKARVLTSGDYVNGFLKTMILTEPETLDSGLYPFGPLYIPFTLNSGIYTNSDMEMNVYNATDIYARIAATILETESEVVSDNLMNILTSGANWLMDVQHSDGGIPIGKVKNIYTLRGEDDGGAPLGKAKNMNQQLDDLWAINCSPGGTAKVAAGLSVISQVFAVSDEPYRDTIIGAATKAWDFVSEKMITEGVDEFKKYENAGHGTYLDVITAAMELYRATLNETYKQFADKHILEAVVIPESCSYQGGEDPEAVWPYRSISGTDAVLYSNFLYHLARYHEVADDEVKEKILAQIGEYKTQWLNPSVTWAPWNFPAHQLFPTEKGWGLAGGAVIETMMQLYRATNDGDYLTYAANVWDYMLGANPYGSNLLIGGRGRFELPVDRLTSRKNTGAIGPGPLPPITDAWRLGADAESSASYPQYSMAFVHACALLNSHFGKDTFQNHPPEKIGFELRLPDGVVGQPFEFDFTKYLFDVDDDGMRFVLIPPSEEHSNKQQNWYDVTCDGALTGTFPSVEGAYTIEFLVDDYFAPQSPVNATIYVWETM